MTIFADESVGPAIYSRLPDPGATRFIAALVMIERYTAHAHVQHDRIREFRDLDPGAPGWFGLLNRACCDVHMYFTCWRQVSVMMRAAAREAGKAQDLRPVMDLYGRTHGQLNVYDEARHAFEHLDERIPGGRMVDDLVDRSDMGLFAADGNSFSFGGLSYDISASSIDLLERLVTDFLMTVRTSLGLSAEIPPTDPTQAYIAIRSQ